MSERPCGQSDCPIVDPATIDRRSLRTVTWTAGATRFRANALRYGTKVFAPPATGNGRFSPIDGRGHAYVAEQRSAAILESALHEATGDNPRIYKAQLAKHALLEVRFANEVRLIDLRDDALADLGLDPGQLTDAGPRHYGCTQQIAAHIAGAKRTQGLVWTSRQGRLHAQRNPDGLAAEVLRHQSLDVAVVYTPDYSGRTRVLQRTPLVDSDTPSRFVVELANLLRIAVL